MPVIVSVHGGPEGQEQPGFNAIYQYFLSRGYAILAPNVRGSTGYGKTYTHLDDFAAAQRCFERLVAIHPQHADAWCMLGVASREQRRFDDAFCRGG